MLGMISHLQKMPGAYSGMSQIDAMDHDISKKLHAGGMLSSSKMTTIGYAPC